MDDMRLYHVVGPGYEDGEPIYTFEELLEAGVVEARDWKWLRDRAGTADLTNEEATPYLLDTDFVSVFETLEDAEESQRLYGGRILTVVIPAVHVDRLGRNGEGYRDWYGRVPAEFVVQEV